MIKILIISFPSLVILTRYYTGRMLFGLFYQNFDKIHQLQYQLYTSKIEPIKAGFSTNDRLVFMGPTYL